MIPAGHEVDIGARRVFRLALTVALTTAGAYASGMDLPFLAPLFACMLGAAPKPPPGLRDLVGLSLMLAITLGTGLLLVPMLIHYPFAALLVVMLGLFFSNYISVNLGKGPVGAFLTIGMTLISAAGLASFELAVTLVDTLIVSVVMVVACLWVVYPLFPEDGPAPEPPPGAAQLAESPWIAIRATLIVMPTYLLALSNPGMYLAIVMKAVTLGQQVSEEGVRASGWELLASTFLGGVLSLLFWWGLSLHPNLWMFFLWMLLTAIYVGAKFYGVVASRYPASFWLNVIITLIILVGPAVADSAGGKDPYKGFAVRISLFIAVTIYAWMALRALEWLRERQARAVNAS